MKTRASAAALVLASRLDLKKATFATQARCHQTALNQYQSARRTDTVATLPDVPEDTQSIAAATSSRAKKSRR